MSSPIDILLVDDQELLRMGFRMVLDAQPDMRVIGEADNGLAVHSREPVRTPGPLRLFPGLSGGCSGGWPLVTRTRAKGQPPVVPPAAALIPKDAPRIARSRPLGLLLFQGRAAGGHVIGCVQDPRNATPHREDGWGAGVPEPRAAEVLDTEWLAFAANYRTRHGVSDDD